MPDTTGDPRVDAELAEIARAAPTIADAARAGFEGLTWGEGLRVLTLYGLADFLWYQLPVKWLVELEAKQAAADALAVLFDRLELPRYAALCAAPVTSEILASYEQDLVAGKRAYRAALEATGVKPPDVPGLVEWGAVMGGAEYEAYREVTVALERAIEDGELKPGASGWRSAAQHVTERSLNSRRDEVTGTTWLQWMHTERLQHWAELGGATRRRLAGEIADGLVHPVPMPTDAEDHIGPLQWLLDHAAAGAPLTQSNYLARPLVVEASRRFSWPTGPTEPRTEAHVVELLMVRDLAKQLRLVRRSRQKLLLSTFGRSVHAAGTRGLWEATMTGLLGESDQEASAGEIALMLLLSNDEHTHQGLRTAVAEVLAEGGWRDAATNVPIDPDGASYLLGHVRRMLELFTLAAPLRWDSPVELNEAGRAAARGALRARALRARTNPYS